MISQSNSSSSEQTVVSLYSVDDLEPHNCGYCDKKGSVSVGNFLLKN